MQFVLVALGGFAAFYTELVIFQPEFGYNVTFPAGTATIFCDTEMALSGNAVDRFASLLCRPVIGGAGCAHAYRLLLFGE
jgi:hypothetical protein